MKLRLAVLLILLLAGSAGAEPHFRLGKGKYWVQIRSFDRATGLLNVKDYRHNLRWEMLCQLPREQRQQLVAERGLMVKMRFCAPGACASGAQPDEHTVELRLGRPDSNGNYQLAWVLFSPQRLILL